jgi:hypothetical protein
MGGSLVSNITDPAEMRDVQDLSEP